MSDVTEERIKRYTLGIEILYFLVAPVITIILLIK